MDKAQIVELLRTNDKALCRALVLLNNRQTTDEQAQEHTKYHNGRGFRPCHAKMGTSMATFFTKRGYLSPKQLAYWRKPMKDGNMKIGIYWAQLLEEANAKAARTAILQPIEAVAAPIEVQQAINAAVTPQQIQDDIDRIEHDELDAYMKRVQQRR